MQAILKEVSMLFAGTFCSGGAGNPRRGPENGAVTSWIELNKTGNDGTLAQICGTVSHELGTAYHLRM